MNFYEQLFSRGRTTGEGMTHFERLFAAKFGGSPPPEVREYTGAVPVTITADGTPLLDYLISGNTVQSGTPTPDNPIQPQGCGERTANLFVGDYSQFDNQGGTGTTYAYFKINEDFTLTFKAKNTVTVPQDWYIGISANGGNNSGGVTWTIGSNNTITAGDVRTVKSSTNNYHCFCFYPKNQTVFDWLVENFEVMLNEGNTALPYEPYGFEIPISSAGQTNNIYLGEVPTTRKIKKLVLTGAEGTWKKSSSYQGSFYNALLDTPAYTIPILCSHAVYVQQITPTTYVYGKCTVDGSASIKNLNLFIGEPSWSVSDFQQYLAAQYAAGTPVTIWYVLVAETTGIVNEPLMKIGDYADTVSKAQAGVEIPTNNGSTTIDVDTEVKPSEVYIKYMGR